MFDLESVPPFIFAAGREKNNRHLRNVV